MIFLFLVVLGIGAFELARSSTGNSEKVLFGYAGALMLCVAMLLALWSLLILILP